MKITLVEVTPEKAEFLLSKNYEHNRKVRKSVVDAYAKDMAEGRWNDEACDPIRIANDGTLIDGQHRLLAVIKSGATRTFVVQSDLGKEAYKQIDSGLSRKAADVVSVPNARLVVAVSRVALDVEQGFGLSRSMNDTRLTKQEVVEFVESHKEAVVDLGKKVGRLRQALKRGYASAIAAFVIAAEAADKELANLFIDDIAKEDPTLKACRVAKNKIMTLYLNDRMKPSREAVLGTLLQAFDAALEGRDIKCSNKYGQKIEKYDRIIKEARANAD